MEDENRRELIRSGEPGEGKPFPSQLVRPAIFNVKPETQPGEIDWQRILRVLRKHWKLSSAFVFMVLVIVIIGSFKMKNTYEPTARLEIDPPGSETFSLRDLATSRMDDQDYIETQIQILQSDEIAVATIRTLRLDQNPEIVGKEELEQTSQEPVEENASRTELTKLENRALRSFRSRLTVGQVRNSRLATVSFTSYDPRLAALVTNTLVNLYIDRNYRTRYETTMQASEWLQNQLTDLRKKVEDSNQGLVEYQRRNGIVDTDEKQNLVTQKVAELNRQFTQALADRIQLEAAVKMVEMGAIDSLPQIHDNLLVQSLVQRYVDARAQLAQALAIYGDKNPNVKKLAGQVNELEAQLNGERQRVVAELKTSYQTSMTREKLLGHAVDEMKGVVTSMNEKMIRYNVLKNEAAANTELYNNLLGKLKEAGITAGLKSSNIRVVDGARVLDKPTGPHRLQNIIIGLLLGLLGGIGLAFLKESLDTTIRTPDDVKEITGLPSLAMLPFVPMANGAARQFRLLAQVSGLLGESQSKHSSDGKWALFLTEPNSPAAEAVRSLHTSVALSRSGHPPQAILISSPSPGEGKTTVSVNLATVLSQQGRTCLVDGDFRRPCVARFLGLSSSQGMTNLLTGSADLGSVLFSIPDFPNLTVLPVGPFPPNPGELIASPYMRNLIATLRERFKYIVIDSPPIIPFADARVLSQFTDGVIIVGRSGGTTRRAVLRAAELLFELDARILGVVLNGVDIRSPDYQYYHYGRGYSSGGYYSYRYGQGRQEKDDQVEEL